MWAAARVRVRAAAALVAVASVVSMASMAAADRLVDEDARLREERRARATTGPLSIAPPDEPGARLIVRGTVRDGHGKPVAGALLYVYQTDARGTYTGKSSGVGAVGEDHARLFGFLRTDARGGFELHTIRPASYPGQRFPAHIHVYLDPPGKNVPVRGWDVKTEIVFDDDPLLVGEARTTAVTDGYAIASPKKRADGVAVATVELKLP